MRPIQITSFLGVRNTNPLRSIPNNALSSAIDVNLSDTGVLTQRDGFPATPTVPLANITAAYTTLDQTSYVVANGTLYRFNADLSTTTIAPCNATAFSDFGKTLFTNDGLRISDDNAVNIKLETPSLPPNVVLISGSLPEGEYGVCYCYKSIASGLKSGSSPAQIVELVDDQHGISIVPVTPPSGYTVTYYTTEAGGSVYYNSHGVALQQGNILANPFPDGVEQICFHKSRLWVSQTLPTGGSIVWFSDMHHYHLYDVVQDYLMVPGKILAMVSLPQGLLVCTDVAMHLCDTNGITPVADYGVVPGSPVQRVVGADGTADKAIIHTLRGQCEALPFNNLTEKLCSFAPGYQCSTRIVYKDGEQKFIVLTDGSGNAFNAAY